MLALSTLVQVVMVLAIPPDAGRILFVLAGEVLGWLIQERLSFPM
jgi:hypothetical protein